MSGAVVAGGRILFATAIAASLACVDGVGVVLVDNPLPPLPPLPFTINGVLSSGQSLSIGERGVPPRSTTQVGGNLQLHDSGGTYSNPASGTWSTVALVAPVRAELFQNDQFNTAAYPLNINGESVDVTTANALALTMSGAVLVSTCGQGSADMSVIKKGGTGNAYQSLLDEVTVATGLLGASYGVAFATLVHGESDWGVLYYDRELLVYQAQLEADVQAITGQTRAVPLILSQQNTQPSAPTVTNNGSAMGQVRACQMGESVIKTTAAFAYDSGAISTATLTGDGYVECTIVDEATTGRAIGLTHTYSGISYTAFDFAIAFIGGNVHIVEGGVDKSYPGTDAVGDVFRITRTGTTITYSRNGTVIYTSLAVSTGSLAVQVVANQQWAGIYKIVLSTGAKCAPWLHVTGGAVATDSDKILFAGPEYQRTYYSDRLHYPAASYRLLGEMFAKVAKAYLTTGWTPMLPTGAVRVGNDVTVTFSVPVGPLVWDGTATAPHLSGALSAWALGKGFEARTGGATGTLVTINSVTIVGSTVVIACASQPDYIAYATTPDATTGATGGFPDGRCGLLRDSDGTVGLVTGLPQSNWCPTFEWSVP